MKDKEKSIIKEAIIDYGVILEAAAVVAKDDLAKQFPDKFNSLIKERLSEGKKTAKDSYVADEADENEEADENNKNEIEETVMKDQKKETKKVVSENVEGKVFVPKALANEEFNIAELDLNDVDSNNNEYLTMEEIEKELNDFENGGDVEPDGDADDMNLGDETPIETEAEPEDDTMSVLLDLKAKINTLIDTLGGGSSEEGEPEVEPENEFEPEVEPEQEFDDSENIAEEDAPISDEEIDAILNSQDQGENEIEEAHGVTYSSRRSTVAGKHTPNSNYLSKGELDQSPSYMQESKKLNGLIKENKDLTKKVNTILFEKKELESLLAKHKEVLGKYRTQLSEMAVFNTNLSHVNNLLVNEEFALTQNDKINIISGFKTVKSINESQEKYKSFVGDFKSTKKNIVESISEKMGDSIQPSSTLIVEKTIYSNKSNTGIDRIKKVIDTIERNKK